MGIKELPKRITLKDILYHKQWILELVDTFGMEIPEDIDGHEFKKIWDRWVDRGGESNYYFAEELRKGLNKYLIDNNKEVNECGVQGGATPACVGGMGDIVLPAGEPGSGQPGSGDIPLPGPTGVVYKQIQPFDQFIRKAGWKRRRRKFKGKPTKNAHIYAYVDDFRTYARRVGHIAEAKLADADYMDGFCHRWVLDNFTDGDEIFVMTGYDPDTKDTCLIHCGLMRGGRFVDVRGEMESKEDVTGPFGEDDGIQFSILNMDEFKRFCEDFGLLVP
jgi:hypothetical protein